MIMKGITYLNSSSNDCGEFFYCKYFSRTKISYAENHHRCHKLVLRQMVITYIVPKYVVVIFTMFGFTTYLDDMDKYAFD